MAMLCTTVGSIGLLGPWIASLMLNFMRGSFGNLGNSRATVDLRNAVETGGSILLPLFAIFVSVALLVQVAQGGLVFSPKIIGPKLNRIDPFKRARQMFFSPRAFVELLKSVLKVVIVGAITAWVLLAELPAFTALVHRSPSDLSAQIFTMTVKIGGLSSLAMASIAALDFFFNRWDIEKRMKMTQQEAKEEQKEQEGDPLLRSKRRRRHRELSNNTLLKEVPRADVVLTNPTHFAVALRYDRAGSDSPKVTAKGKSDLALRIRSLARIHGVPIIENKPLARSLYRMVKVGQSIHPDMFRAVAEVYAFLFRRREAGRT